MAAKAPSEADVWLQKIFNEAYAEVSSKYDDHVVVGYVRDKLKNCIVEFQRAIMKAIEKWLLSYNQDHVVLALMLVELLEATEFIPALRKLRWRVIFRLSPLPWNELSYVGSVLRMLEQMERQTS